MPNTEAAPNLGVIAGGAAAATISGFATTRVLGNEPDSPTPDSPTPDSPTLDSSRSDTLTGTPVPRTPAAGAVDRADTAEASPWDDRPGDSAPDRQTLIQPSETSAGTPEPSIVAAVNTTANPTFSSADYSDYSEDDEPDFAISTFTVNSRANCFVLEPHQMQRLQSEVGVSKALEPGNYIIRIKSGNFSYRSGTTGEPLVMLWIYGGRVMNLQTQVPVEATWSTLNGYDDSLHLQVFEPAMLCAFFFDTHLGDNEGDVTIMTTKL
jgi:hypothetical protein